MAIERLRLSNLRQYLTDYQKRRAAFSPEFSPDKCDKWTREELVHFLRAQPQKRVKELVLLNFQSSYFKDLALLIWTSTESREPSSKKLKRAKVSK